MHSQLCPASSCVILILLILSILGQPSHKFDSGLLAPQPATHTSRLRAHAGCSFLNLPLVSSHVSAAGACRSHDHTPRSLLSHIRHLTALTRLVADFSLTAAWRGRALELSDADLVHLSALTALQVSTQLRSHISLFAPTHRGGAHAPSYTAPFWRSCT